jgi:glycosyltransferase involved in cell wall biosynthesis
MKILAIASSYPYDAFPFSGIFNEKCVQALRQLCDYVEVLAPRPYVPAFLAVTPRWKLYSGIAGYEQRNGIPVNRPPVVQIPGIGGSFWYDRGAFLACGGHARRLHRTANFDAIVSFDLLGAGGLAWQIGKDLGIPACGWAFGSDVRVPAASSDGRSVARTLRNLDLIFYQSAELRQKAAELLDRPAAEMRQEKHVVLPHGIPVPSTLPGPVRRDVIRKRWGVAEDAVVVLSVGRITGQKGSYDLLEAAAHARSLNRGMTFIMVGSMPAFDETETVQKRIASDPRLKDNVKILPPCSPDKIWDVLCGADIFAFASHNEGMPNSLLEAMAAGLPAVAFSIPAVQELDGGTESLIEIEPFDTGHFGYELATLAASPDKRIYTGERGRKRVLAQFRIEKNMAQALGKIGRLVYP